MGLRPHNEISTHLIHNYDDICKIESEICRLLQTVNGKCSQMHTEHYTRFRSTIIRQLCSKSKEPFCTTVLLEPQRLMVIFEKDEHESIVSFRWQALEYPESNTETTFLQHKGLGF
jgi:hypothetical protein